MRRHFVAILLIAALMAAFPCSLRAQEASPNSEVRRPTASTQGIPGIFAFLIRDFFSEAWRSPATYTRAACDAGVLLTMALVVGTWRRSRR